MNTILRKTVAIVVTLGLLLGSVSAFAAEAKPDTWIADRVIHVQAYVDDIGYSMPDDPMNTPVMQELKRLTGITIDFMYTPGENDRSVMAAQLATGDLPDLILFYLNNSARPEFPILYSAAKDGMFVNLTPMFENSTNLRCYTDPEWCPVDAYDNVMFRKDFNGACYIVQRGIENLGRKTPVVWKETTAHGGLYIQTAIVEDLGIDPTSINTSEKLYELMKTIKEKDYKDVNGKSVIPLGPKYWGGSPDAANYVVNDLHWGVSGNFNMTEDGKILHEVETDYVFQKIDYFRKLMAEELVHKEYFTMDSTRAKELYENKSAAIISDVHGGEQIIWGSYDWTPLGNIADYKGNTWELTSGAGGYGGWAIPATTENPEEVFALMDFLSGEQGYKLFTYGVEGVHYTYDDKGWIVPSDEVRECIINGDGKTLQNIGANFNGSGEYGMGYMLTKYPDKTAFAPDDWSWTGSGENDEAGERLRYLSKTFPGTYYVYEGLTANSFMGELPEFQNQFNLLNYNDRFAQAVFAKDDAQVQQIVESFRNQLKAAGIEEYEKLVEEKYQANPDSVFVY